MSVQLSSSNYGKGAVRVKKVTKHKNYHEVKDFSVSTICEGDFTETHRSGDNSMVLPTDTQKNTVYALAHKHDVETIESYGIYLAKHLLKANKQFTSVVVEIEETLWERIKIGAKQHPHAYRKGGAEKWTTKITHTKSGTVIESGIKDLMILKTTDSSFSDFLRDKFTTLKDADDRMLMTNLTSSWVYNSADVDFAKLRKTIQNTLLSTFAKHKSLSVQHTLYAMGEAALKKAKAVSTINLDMPNKHNLLVDLSKFKMKNNNQTYHVTEEPYGIIRGTMTRG